MAVDPVAGRYAQALFESAKADGQRDETLEQVRLLARLLTDVPDLRQFMLNPDVDPPQKVGVLDRALRGSWSPLVRAFTELVVRAARAESFAGIAEAFQVLADQDAGRIWVTVLSAHPLERPQVERLREAIARREAKQVEIVAEIDPELIGGLQVRLEHRVIDGSVQRQLADLRQRLHAVRVH